MIFPAKILLFGEHTVLKGSEALAIPFEHLSGSWCTEKNEIQAERLTGLVNYLEKSTHEEKFLLDIDRLKHDVFEKKIWFQSNIPEGYGAGSSGALIAAMYHEYVYKKATDAVVLKKQLGAMESFFHGASSGFDPLVSYLKKTVHIHSDKSICVLEKKHTPTLSVFLIDTHIARKTETYVHLFLKKYTDSHFAAQINQTLIPESNAGIQLYLQENNTDLLFETLHKISWSQYRFMNEMIPPAFKNLWLTGLSSDQFKIKLCGAGGGGFLLCFSNNAARTEIFLKENRYTFLSLPH